MSTTVHERVYVELAAHFTGMAREARRNRGVHGGTDGECLQRAEEELRIVLEREREPARTRNEEGDR